MTESDARRFQQISTHPDVRPSFNSCLVVECRVAPLVARACVATTCRKLQILAAGHRSSVNYMASIQLYSEVLEGRRDDALRVLSAEAMSAGVVALIDWISPIMSSAGLLTVLSCFSLTTDNLSQPLSTSGSISIVAG